ncbi:6-bladed beta-propeller [Candidatus Palauibacter sp.]|uniref:6-bladed beta-propeller n=1 Tax=Candidatus Palauibacter sp. TaxID=3101350 RepID=UPI003B0268FC
MSPGHLGRTVRVLSGLLIVTVASPASGAVMPHVPQEVTADTLDSGRIVVSNPVPGRGGGSDEWSLVEELRLGQIDGTGPEVFGHVHDVAVDEKGHIYVLDVASKEVRVFDREGRHLRNMARDGEGPGEFRYSGFSPVYRIIWQPPNRLWIGDLHQQLSFDSLGNELSRSGQPFGPGMPISGAAMMLRRGRVVAADGEGFVYQQVGVSDRTTQRDEAVTHSRTYGVRLPVYPEHPNPVVPRDSLLLDSRVTTSISQTTSRSGPTISVGGFVKTTIPRRVWAFGRSGTAWLANRAVYRFHEVTFAGDTVRTVELGDPPRPPPDDSDEADYAPLIADLEVSPEGWLWVRRHQDDLDEDPAWDVFDNCGRYRGEVSTSDTARDPSWQELGPGPHGSRRGGRDPRNRPGRLDVSYVLRLRLESARGTSIVVEECP